ncbi:hypothetical protein [Ferruginibacter sp. HRS2-29]|uniref:hypothetical protein n=1 Tax=Ferruginibacter sp. HRS2-29 TaxID=2487334 RepID=UPI0020CF4142|nr:hypothetical protein [Ferruginibacter sp. HRS2-29]
MLLFFTGVFINCAAIVLIILSSIKDALSARQTDGRNDLVHIAALVLAGVVAVSFYHKNNGNIFLAKLLVCLPATPILLSAVFLAAAMLLKPNWK